MLRRISQSAGPRLWSAPALFLSAALGVNVNRNVVGSSFTFRNLVDSVLLVLLTCGSWMLFFFILFFHVFFFSHFKESPSRIESNKLLSSPKFLRVTTTIYGLMHFSYYNSICRYDVNTRFSCRFTVVTSMQYSECSLILKTGKGQRN